MHLFWISLLCSLWNKVDSTSHLLRRREKGLWAILLSATRRQSAVALHSVDAIKSIFVWIKQNKYEMFLHPRVSLYIYIYLCMYDNYSKWHHTTWLWRLTASCFCQTKERDRLWRDPGRSWWLPPLLTTTRRHLHPVGRGQNIQVGEWEASPQRWHSLPRFHLITRQERRRSGQTFCSPKTSLADWSTRLSCSPLQKTAKRRKSR